MRKAQRRPSVHTSLLTTTRDFTQLHEGDHKWTRTFAQLRLRWAKTKNGAHNSALSSILTAIFVPVMLLTSTLMPLAWLLYFYSIVTEVSGLWWWVTEPFIFQSFVKEKRKNKFIIRRAVGSRLISDPHWVCRKAKRLRSPAQTRMCRDDFELVKYIVAGTRRGVEQCQHELRFHRWNCTEQKKSIGNMLLRGNVNGHEFNPDKSQASLGN